MRARSVWIGVLSGGLTFGLLCALGAAWPSVGPVRDLAASAQIAADTTDPQVIKFANERARPMADKLSLLHYEVEAWLADWSAQGISAKITAAGASEYLADGSLTDGRPRVTGTQLINMRAALLQIQTALDTTAVSGVGAAPWPIVNAIQVNGSPR